MELLTTDTLAQIHGFHVIYGNIFIVALLIICIGSVLVCRNMLIKARQTLQTSQDNIAELDAFLDEMRQLLHSGNVIDVETVGVQNALVTMQFTTTLNLANNIARWYALPISDPEETRRKITNVSHP